MQSSNFSEPSPTIRLAFSQDRLELLIRQGKLHAADFNCLDKKSKKTVWGMLLSATAGQLKRL